MNKGKLPIEQLSHSCAPPTNNKSRSTICLNEAGIFYPGTEYWIDILIRARIPTVQSSRSKRFAWPGEYFGIPIIRFLPNSQSVRGKVTLATRVRRRCISQESHGPRILSPVTEVKASSHLVGIKQEVEPMGSSLHAVMPNWIGEGTVTSNVPYSKARPCPAGGLEYP
jgi:hypothetical protein